MPKESHNLEFKRIWKDDLLKWISAFANADGGVLLLGYADDGQVIGLQQVSKLLEDIPNKVRDVLGIIANSFFRTGLIEAWGRIIEAYQQENHPVPQWQGVLPL
jgi:predicted HTH transcriptional regulator